MSQPRIRIPRTARRGEAIEIRTLIDHPMETGIRLDGSKPPPRNMLNRLLVRMNGETVFSADLRNGTAANPYHVLFVTVEKTSDFEFVWTGEDGRSFTAAAKVTVT